jgi:hypothetical protein
MVDVRRGIWSELEGAGAIRIDVYRRNLQNSYIDLLSNKLNVRPAVTDDYRALIKAELRDLGTAIGAASARATDRQTRAHLADARDQIAKALDIRLRRRLIRGLLRRRRPRQRIRSGSTMSLG